MNISIKENKEKSEVELTIDADAGDLKPFVDAAAKKLSKEKSIKGFRPGKAPADVVAEAMGEDRLLSEAVDRAVPKLFVEAVLEKDIDAVDRPKVAVNKLSRLEGLSFTATVVVLPEVTLGDLRGITIEKREVASADKDVEKELTRLTEMRKDYIDVARGAAKDDVVTVDFKIMVNGEVIEGGEGTDHRVELGKGGFVKDFEDNLIGISAGDTREFAMKFPDDYGHDEFKGKEAQAQVTAKAVQKAVTPKLDDEFAKKTGNFDSLDALRKQVKENLQREGEQKEKERQQGEMTSKLADIATFSEIPDVLVEKEIDRQLEEFSRMLEMQQKTLEDYMQGRERTLEQIREEMREKALENVKTGLALRAFIDSEDIEVTEEEITEKVNEYLQRFGSPQEAQKSVDVEELKEQLLGMVRNQKAMEALEKKVTTKEVPKVTAKTEEKK